MNARPPAGSGFSASDWAAAYSPLTDSIFESMRYALLLAASMSSAQLTSAYSEPSVQNSYVDAAIVF